MHGQDDRETYLKIALLLVGLCSAIVGTILTTIWPTSPRGQDLGLEVFIVGVLALAIDFIFWASTRETSSDISYTTGDQNWNHAVKMMRGLRRNHTAYDVSSIPNRDDFIKAFLEKVRDNTVVISRIFAYNPEESPEMHKWVKGILDENAIDFKSAREALRTGHLRVLHLPYSFDTDFFITERPKRENGGGEVVMGIPTRVEGGGAYDGGLYSDKREVVGDFVGLFELLRNQAQIHQAQDASACELCKWFVVSRELKPRSIDWERA